MRIYKLDEKLFSMIFSLRTSTLITSLALIPFSKSYTFKNIHTTRLTMSASSTEINTHLFDIINNFNEVKQKVDAALVLANRDPTLTKLVAVSKTKPVEDIRALYDIGHRHFGENYFQELTEKCKLLPTDINWHFIGHLQSSKAAKLIKEVPNLYVVETVDSLKLATKLNNACEAIKRAKLDICIQVHTSDEETKSGVTPDALNELVESIVRDCPLLHIAGLMTIGAPDDYTCFDKLAQCRVQVADFTNRPIESFQLSMGMSGDFEEAIARGATSVRVGSTIFGARNYNK